MTLTPGARIGPYTITSRLGAGGMGEVYRARVTKLERDVAIKVLRADVAGDRERLARFSREARVLAALNHPNIAHVIGLEDAADAPALVMELVEGLTLDDRIAADAVPLDEAIGIAGQIADALEAAHDRGIIHRDLKPANVMIRPDGLVKVLDFGLAKALDPTDPQGIADQANSPTITSPAMTMRGVILGTAAYMAPEQAKGRPVDRRADIWACGCVLYEMLTARRAFEGEDTTETIAAVVSKDPDWTALPPSTPTSIRRLLQRMLVKNPKQRIDSAAVLRLELAEAAAALKDGVTARDPSRDAGAGRRWALLPMVATGLLAAIGASLATWAAIPRPATPTAAPTRFGIALAPAHALAVSINDRDLAISADGQRLVFTAGADAQIMVREFEQLAARPLSGITDARAPFLSPDGRWVGFFSRLEETLNTGPVSAGSLRKASLTGGPAVVVCQLTGASRGASWAPDDTILFATNDPSTGLFRVAAGGGEPTVLTTPDAAKGELDHHYPVMLPGGNAVLFTIFTMTRAGAERRREIAVLDLRTGEHRTVVRDGAQAEYVDTGHLVYIAGDALWAVRFDLDTLTTRGDPAPVVERLRSAGAANFSVSNQGTLVYSPRRASATGERSLVWVDRSGRQQPIAAPLRRYGFPRLSADGTRIAVRVQDEQGHMWIFHLARQTLTRLTDNGPTFMAVWAPDGRSIVFNGGEEGSQLFRRPADGPGTDELLLAAGTGTGSRLPTSVSPDGTRLVYHESAGPGSLTDLMTLRLDGAVRAEPLLQTPADEKDGEISPDGRWLAYDSAVSGRAEVYVRPFPNVNDGFVQVSSDGGRTPVWGPGGRELFFVDGTRMMAAAIATTPTFAAERATVLFDDPSLLLDARSFATSQRNFDVSPRAWDGIVA